MQIKSKHANDICSNIWTDSTGIWPILCSDLSAWMSHGSTTVCKKPNSSRNCEWKLVVQQKKKKAKFWDAKGILLLYYPEKDRTITGKYYSNLLDQLDVKIHEKRPGLKKKQKNHLSLEQHTCSQKCVGIGKTVGFLVRFAWSSPLFSWFGTLRLPSLPKPEEIFSEEHFASSEVERAVNEYCNSLPECHFWERILILKMTHVKDGQKL